jgi:hypothetical protein
MMRKILMGLTFVMLFNSVYADIVFAIESRLDVGSAYYTLQEDTSQGTLKESGPIWTLGLSLSSSLTPETKTLRGHANVEVFWGQVDYDSKTQSGVPVNTDTNYRGFKIEASTGWPIVYQTDDESDELREQFKAKGIKILKSNKKRVLFSVEPFIGLAVRWWDRMVENAAPTPGRIELYRTFYARAGILGSWMPKKSTEIYWAFSADPMLLAQERTQNSTGVLFLENGRRLGWEFEAGGRFQKISATAYWQATRLGESDVVSGYSQPKSDQDIIGLKLGYLF